MAANPKLQEYVEEALKRGIPESSLPGVLKARGWSEKEICAVLAAHYEGASGIVIPTRSGSETAAKDAFFYLLVFSTLATWTIGLGALAFNLIDRWLADTLFSTPYGQGYDVYAIASAMAAVLVAFPIFLLVSRSVLHDERSHPEILGSPGVFLVKLCVLCGKGFALPSVLHLICDETSLQRRVHDLGRGRDVWDSSANTAAL